MSCFAGLLLLLAAAAPASIDTLARADSRAPAAVPGSAFARVDSLAPATLADSALARADSLAAAIVADSAFARADSRSAVADSVSGPPSLPVVSVTLVGDGAGDAGLIDPTGIAVDTFGRVYVTDAGSHRLLRLDTQGKPTAEFGSLGSDPSQLQRPSGVALLGTLGVAVLDRDNRRVVTVDLFGRPLGTLIDLASIELERRVGRIDASAIASDRGGALALLDRERDRVLLFDFAGRFVREVGGLGATAGSFRGLRGLAYGPRGELVCADRGNARLQRLDAGGRVAATWPVAVTPGAASLPLAVDAGGRVAMADEAGGTLRLWSADGVLLFETSGLRRPRALAFGSDGSLLVAETSPVRIRRLTFGISASPPRER